MRRAASAVRIALHRQRARRASRRRADGNRRSRADLLMISIDATAACTRLGDLAVRQARSGQRVGGGVEPDRRRRRAADAERAGGAASRWIERDLRGGRRQRKVAAARADLLETDADPAFVPDRKVDRHDAVAVRHRGHHRTGEEIARRDAASRRPLRSATWPPSVASTSAISAAGSAFATEPPTVPRLRVAACPTNGSARASSGTLRAIVSIVQRGDLARRRADRDRRAVVANAVQLADARNVDQPGRPREPHRHHGNQRLPARDDRRIGVGGQAGAGLLDRTRSHIVERGRLHSPCRQVVGPTP